MMVRAHTEEGDMRILHLALYTGEEEKEGRCVNCQIFARGVHEVEKKYRGRNEEREHFPS